MIAYLVIAVVVLAFISLALSIGRGGRFAGLDFAVKAKQAGFSLPEAHVLSEAARAINISDLNSILISPRELDRVICVLMANKSRWSGHEAVHDGTAFMEKVYKLRKQLELDKPRFNSGIKTSRQMAVGQRVRLISPGLGLYGSTLLDNTPSYLMFSYPTGQRLPRSFQWKGKRVSVYFWRRDDAGYVFDSYVIDDLRLRNVPVIYVAHSPSLFRAQKRKSVRSATQLPGRLYLMRQKEGAFERPEREGGLRCQIKDVSEDGFAVLIGGKAAPGLLVKAQFELNGRQIVMSGTVRSADYDSEKNRSVLHVEAVPPSPRTKNAIRAFVYSLDTEFVGIQSESDN